MKITTFSPKEFDKLEKSWKMLETGKDMTAFQLYDWFRNINALYFRERAKHLFVEWIYVLVSDDDGKPLLIAPIEYIKCGIRYKSIGLSRGFYFIGRQGYSDYLNFVYDDFSEEAVKTLFSFLQAKFKTSHVYFEQLLKTTELYAYIEKTYVIEQSECYCAALVLPDTFDEYKALLSKSTKQNIRTAINRQNRDGIELKHELIYHLDESMQETLMAIRAQRLKDKQNKSKKKASWKGRIVNSARNLIRKLFDGTQDVISENCSPWCFLVKHGERIVSYFWGIRNENKQEFYVILAGVDKEYAWYSPSISHLYLFLQELYESKNRTICVLDFTRGGERYKEDLGGLKRALTQCVSFCV